MKNNKSIKILWYPYLSLYELNMNYHVIVNSEIVFFKTSTNQKNY